MVELQMQASELLPEDHNNANLIGRVWNPECNGPSVVTIRNGAVVDITSPLLPTARDFCEEPKVVSIVNNVKGEVLCSLDELVQNSIEGNIDYSRPRLISPVDLQAVKAVGVTFVVSLLERVIEEQARGNPELAADIRGQIQDTIGTDLSNLKPGSGQAEKLKHKLVEQGLWSQYLEVGIGPDPEVFTKAQILSSVGCGAHIGIHPISSWNNPEPEVVVIVNSRGSVVGATLGNDVNLRDVEGRSALLLGKAKDNNASASIGPFIRLLDDRFTMDDVKELRVGLEVRGEDGFILEDYSSMSEISRSPEELVAAVCSDHHQYPDGFALYLGTMFAPTKDRGEEGKGFTHVCGDVVRISNSKLGTLVNQVQLTNDCLPWSYGVRDLMANLSGRGLL